jgi:hypothetical protein
VKVRKEFFNYAYTGEGAGGSIPDGATDGADDTENATLDADAADDQTNDDGKDIKLK